MIDKGRIVDGTVAERRRTIDFLSALAPERFDTPTHLPRWRIREVVAHLITTDRSTLTGSILLPVLRSFDVIEAWNDRQVGRWAGRPVPDLLAGLETWGRRYARFARAVPAAMYRMPLPSMFGRGRGGLLLWARPFDEWVHRQDMRRALDLPDEDEGSKLTAEFLLTAAVSSTLPQVQGPPGVVAVALDGMDPWVYDIGAGRGGPHPDLAAGAAVRIRMPAPAFIMATAGRDRFGDLEASGPLTVEGDADLARRFLSKLRIV